MVRDVKGYRTLNVINTILLILILLGIMALAIYAYLADKYVDEHQFKKESYSSSGYMLEPANEPVKKIGGGLSYTITYPEFCSILNKLKDGDNGSILFYANNEYTEAIVSTVTGSSSMKLFYDFEDFRMYIISDNLEDFSEYISICD